MNESIGQSGQHNEFCEGHVACPVTKKEECGKAVVHKIYECGQSEAATVYCFGCGKTHNVRGIE